MYELKDSTFFFRIMKIKQPTHPLKIFSICTPKISYCGLGGGGNGAPLGPMGRGGNSRKEIDVSPLGIPLGAVGGDINWVFDTDTPGGGPGVNPGVVTTTPTCGGGGGGGGIKILATVVLPLRGTLRGTPRGTLRSGGALKLDNGSGLKVGATGAGVGTCVHNNVNNNNTRNTEMQ